MMISPKCGEGSDLLLKHKSSSFKHGGGSVMACALHGCVWNRFANDDDVTYDGGSGMNSAVYRKILPAKLQCNWEELRHHAARRGSETHWTQNTTKDFIMGGK